VQFDDLTPAQRAAKVLFASTSAPFLRAFAQRQGPRDLVQVKIESSDLQLFFDDELINVLSSFAGQCSLDMTGSLAYEEIVARAAVPYRLSCPEPPPTPAIWNIKGMVIEPVTVRVWCSMDLGGQLVLWLPEFFKLSLRLTSLSNQLCLDGAKLNFAGERFFRSQTPVTFSSAAEVLITRYKSNLLSSLRSILLNSNAFKILLFWKPKKQLKVTTPIQDFRRPGGGLT
jgi:hypothetical protein